VQNGANVASCQSDEVRHVVRHKPAILPRRRFVKADGIATLQRALSHVGLGVIRQAGYRVDYYKGAIWEAFLPETCLGKSRP
jgi:hypothetical protein